MCRKITDSAFSQFQREVERKRQEALNEVDRIPIAALIWGPAPNSTTIIAQARVQLQSALLNNGHVANFSEDLYDKSSKHSNIVQQAAQAEAYDIVFSIPDSPGSIAEIHDFSRLPTISNKIVAFLNSAWNDGYSNKSLMELQTYSTCKIQLYDASNLPECIVSSALDIVYRLQELFYLRGRRAI